jgi:hypothetical protein
MSARSSALEVLVVATALAACRGGPKGPEADPAAVTALYKKIFANVPKPGAVPECNYDQMLGGATVTRKTMTLLAQAPVDTTPPFADYVNATEVDSPAARTLLDSSDDGEKRRAAAELLAAPFHLVYHVDLVDTPLALGVKDFKKGYVGARALRYDKHGAIVCARSFVWTNTKAKKAWAIETTQRPQVTPEVKQAMQDDLRSQMLARIAGLGAPPVYDPDDVVDDRHDR